MLNKWGTRQNSWRRPLSPTKIPPVEGKLCMSNQKNAANKIQLNEAICSTNPMREAEALAYDRD